MLRSAVIIALLLATPLAAAQAHDHEGSDGMAMVLHDGPASGRAVVGSISHFGFALLKDGVPQTHRNAEFAVVQNGVTMFSTTDTHEYDGLFSFDMVFTKPGPYEVTAMSEGMMMGNFTGTAVMPVNETMARIDLTTAPAGPLGGMITATVAILDPNGALLDHTDAVIDVRRVSDGALMSRFTTHIHDEPIIIQWAADLPGDHTFDIVAFRTFATGRSPDFRAVTGSFPFTVEGVQTQGDPQAAPMPLLDAVTSDALSPTGPSATADGYTLYAMYDPQNTVAVGQLFRLAAVLVNGAGDPVPHVDFDFVLNSPRHSVAASTSLHEYDGTFEFVHRALTPGQYEGILKASYNGTELEVVLRPIVLPPAAPLDAGRFRVTLAGVDAIEAGVPTELAFSVTDGMRPLPHSELDVRIFHDDEAPVYRFKLHTHASGEFRASVVFPHAGDWKIAVDPIVLLPQASLVDAQVFDVAVATGKGVPIEALDADPEPAKTVPGLPFGIGIVAIAALALIRRK